MMGGGVGGAVGGIKKSKGIRIITIFCYGVLIMVLIISYSLVCLLSISSPKLVFQSQTPRSRYFLEFDDLNGLN